MSPRNVPSSTPRGPRTTLLWLALVAIGVFVLVGGRSTTEAGDPKQQKVDIAYVAVIGEGQIARAWYDGAPSPGVPVQDALDYFAKEGYHVVRVTDTLRQTTKPDDSSFAILLERVR